MHKGILALAAGMASILLTAAAADLPGTAPEDFGGNPALPSTADLVRFDDASPVPPARLDASGAIQGAFPVFYGAMPASVTPVSPLPVRPPQPPPTVAAATMPPAPASAPERRASAAAAAPEGGTPFPSAPPASGSDADSNTHLAMAPGGNAPASAVARPSSAPAARRQTDTAAPASAASPAPDTRQPALPATPGDTVDLAAFNTEAALDGTPLPPPPLPELPTAAAAPDPIDIAVVRADFNRIKAFCDEDSLGSAAEVYAKMPDFGRDEEANRLRADAANLLILGLSREDNLSAARRIYESVPAVMPGHDATLAKARGVINLATYYVRAERYNDAYDILMDIGAIQNRSALNSELFRLMARMIPYLDNADQTEKAAAVFDLLLAEVTSPGTAALFAENAPGVFKYYLHYVDKSEAPKNRRLRLDFLEHAFAAMEPHAGNPDIRLTRKTLGESLAARYAGDPERAARFYVED